MKAFTCHVINNVDLNIKIESSFSFGYQKQVLVNDHKIFRQSKKSSEKDVFVWIPKASFGK
jgi:hypothetical protein